MDTQQNNPTQNNPTPMQPKPAQNNQPAQNPANNRTLMGILAYLGPLVIVALILGKHDPFVKFHVKQGLVVLCLEAIVWILSSIMWPLWMLLSLINLAAIILSVVGIVNVVQGKEKELPLVGSLARHFPV